MPVRFCTCSSLDAGGEQETHCGTSLHHAVCPSWTMRFNYLYPDPNLHGETFDDRLPFVSRYTFAPNPTPDLYYVLRHSTELYFLDFHALYPLSGTVRKELTHEFTPPTEYLAFRRASREHQQIIYTFAPRDAPLNLSTFNTRVIQAFIMFVHDSPLLDNPKFRLRTTGPNWKKHWVQLWSLAHVFDMPALTTYVLDGMNKPAPAVENKTKGWKKLGLLPHVTVNADVLFGREKKMVGKFVRRRWIL